MDLLIDTNVILDMLSVTNVDIREAFDKKWKGFEDCVQFATAKK